MDTNDYPSLPNLAQLHARLASNNRRVEALVDAQLDGIERLFSATVAEDWEAVAQASRFLATLRPDQVSPEVIRQARQVAEELGRCGPARPPRQLGHLLAACREAKQRKTT